MINYKNLLLISIIATFYSCAPFQDAANIDDGIYKIAKRKSLKIVSDTDTTIAYSVGQKLYIEDYIDSLLLYSIEEKDAPPVKYMTSVDGTLLLQQNSFDIDLFLIPFKIQFAQKDLPQQLNTNFNASMYLGFRKDYFTISPKYSNKYSLRRAIRQNGYSVGTFCGLSEVTMNSSVTHSRLNSDYSGLAISYGFALIYDVKKFNAGIALGSDYLTDKNKQIWIYHNKPWIGVLVGLNLN